MTIRLAFARTPLAIGCLALFGGCAAPPDYLDAAIYSGFPLIDPETRTRTENAWLVVRDGVIASTGAGAPQGRFWRRARGLGGLYGMPGLIDDGQVVVLKEY